MLARVAVCSAPQPAPAASSLPRLCLTTKRHAARGDSASVLPRLRLTVAPACVLPQLRLAVTPASVPPRLRLAATPPMPCTSVPSCVCEVFASANGSNAANTQRNLAVLRKTAQGSCILGSLWYFPVQGLTEKELSQERQSISKSPREKRFSCLIQ